MSNAFLSTQCMGTVLIFEIRLNVFIQEIYIYIGKILGLAILSALKIHEVFDF